MEYFSADEKDRINRAYANNLEDLSADDVSLIIRWERDRALDEATHKAEIAALQAETDSKLELATQAATESMNAVEALKMAAMERLERLS